MAKNNEIDEVKIFAVLCYLFPVGLIWYLLDDKMRKNRFAAFHVHQSFAAFLFVLAGYIAGLILMIVLIGVVVMWIAWIAALVWFIQGLVNSLNGKEQELFLIGSIGKRFKF